MRVTIDGKRATLAARLDGPTLDKLRGMPGRSRWVDRSLLFEATAANLDYVKTTFPHAVFDDPQGRMAQVALMEELESSAAERKRSGAVAVPPAEALAFPFKTTPRAHQMEAFGLMRMREFFALFMEMGTGKTKTTIDIIAYKYSVGEIDCVLVIAPNGVHTQWHEREVPAHMPDFVGRQEYAYRSGRKHDERIFAPSNSLRMLYMNVEALSHASGFDFAIRFMLTGRVFVIVDESTVIKNPSSQRSKNVRKLGRNSAARAILCGAPITRSLEDIFGQFLFLSEDALGHSSLLSFRNRYCDVVPAYSGAPRGAVKVVGFRNVEEFTRKVDAHSFRKTKDECLDLPPKVYLPNREVELHPEQRRMYNELKKDSLTSFGSQFIDVENAVSKLTRLQQILGGHVTDEDGNLILVPSYRVRELMAWREEAGAKCIVWARFRPDIDLICEAYKKAGVPFVRFDGSVSRADREAGEKLFLEQRGEVDMIANPAAAARGKNWQVANDVAYYSNSFDADLRWQSEDRTHRDGMVGTCTYTDFVAKGTVDKKILDALKSKKSIADSILDDRAGWEAALSE